MLNAQHDAIVAAVSSLEKGVREHRGTEEILLRFRLESTRAVLRFIDGMLTAEPAPAAAVS